MSRPRTLPDARPRKCRCCGKVFTPARKLWKQIYCTKTCSAKSHCTAFNAAPKTLEWRLAVSASKRTNTNGYRKYLGRHEHRFVMEMLLGRKLQNGEVVHHKDGNRSNNSPSNLELCTSQSEHCRAHDFGHYPGANRSRGKKEK